MASVPVIDLGPARARRSGRPSGDRPRDRRRLPRDRLLRHHRPRDPRRPGGRAARARPRVLRAAPRGQARGPASRRGHQPRLSSGGRRDAGVRQRHRGAARPEGVLPRGPGGRLRRPVLHGSPGPPALRAEPLAGRAGGLRARGHHVLPGHERAHPLAHAAGRPGPRRGGGLLRRQGGPLDRHHAAQLLPGPGRAPRARPASRQRPHRLRRVHDPERRGRPRRPAGAHARRSLGGRADLPHHLRGEHRRPADALDQRPVALEPAPRGEPARDGGGGTARACPSPSSITRTTTRSSSACPRRAPLATPRCSRATTAT